MKQTVLIVGAGLSGLTAGIYCLDNGFDVTIYEKSAVAGGECTGWYRQGQYIDGCAHWIVGTSPKSELFPLWKHIGAFDEHTKIYPTEYLTKFDTSRGVVTLYSNLNRLAEELIHFYPEDRKNILKLIKAIKAYQRVRIPVEAPLEQENLFGLLRFSLPMAPLGVRMLHYKHLDMESYIRRFKNRELGEILTRFLRGEYNSHSLFYIFQALSQGDAGMVEGGSLKMMQRVKERYLSLGGKLMLNTPVEEIVVENKKAIGLTLKSGSFVPADYVIAACDAHYTLYHLLKGKYHDKYFEERFSDTKTNPINSGLLLSYKTKANVDDKPKMYDVPTGLIRYFGEWTDHFAIRNYSFDKTLQAKDGSTLLTVLLPAGDIAYKTAKAMSKDEYQKEKARLASIFQKLIALAYGLQEEDIIPLDVTTPLTYERYCNAYMGSYMSFVTTAHSRGLMRDGELKGVKNLVLSGQWIMPPGGLPIALFTGKHAAQRVAKLSKRKFLDFTEFPWRKKKLSY